MTASAPQVSELERLLTKWRSVRGDSDRWELILAGDVLALESRWDQLRDEARQKDERRGPEFTVWLTRTFGRKHGLDYWKRHAEAVRRIGEHARRRWHSKAALWAMRFDDVSLRRLDQAVGNEWRRLSGGDSSFPVLPLAAVVRIATSMGLYEPGASRVVCKRCAELERRLRELGDEV